MMVNGSGGPAVKKMIACDGQPESGCIRITISTTTTDVALRGKYNDQSSYDG
jgi:hypothetical protein